MTAGSLVGQIQGHSLKCKSHQAKNFTPRRSLQNSFLGSGSNERCATFGHVGGARKGHRQVTAMASKVTGYIKLALQAGKANPAPPVGPALGSKGVNIMAFCKEYNAATQDKIGTVIPVEITVYEDRSFTFVMKTPPASVLLKKAAKIDKGSGDPKDKKVGKITQEQLKEIAETKLPDLNAVSIEAAMNIVAGTAKNMGITVEEPAPAA